MSDFQTRLKDERKARGLTQAQMADLLSIKRSTYSLYESGKRQPRVKQLQEIAAILNIPISALINNASEAQHIKMTWDWIQNNNEKRQALITEILKTHNYKIKSEGIDQLTITDFQGFQFSVDCDEFEEMCLRCDKDIRYNIEKLLADSKE